MITKYKTNYSNDGIEKVEVVRETAKMVVLQPIRRSGWIGVEKERKEAKTSRDVCYFDSWDAAHNHLMNKASMSVENARMSLERAKGTYGQIKGLKP